MTTSSPVFQVRLALAALARHVVGAWGQAGSGRPLWGESCYLQEFCLIGATVGRRQAEGTEDRKALSHPKWGRQTYFLGSGWTLEQDSEGFS